MIELEASEPPLPEWFDNSKPETGVRALSTDELMAALEWAFNIINAESITHAKSPHSRDL